MAQKFTSLIFTIFLVFTLNAQTDAPDFTVMDIEGNEINLHSILEEGKVVILDCSATWCPPCWAFHEAHFLKDINDKYGPNGTDQVRVIFYEADPATTREDLMGTGSNTLGDWVTGVDYQIVDEKPIQLSGDIYWPLGFPTINVIRPDDKKIIGDLYDPWNAGGGLTAMEEMIEGAFPTTRVKEIEALNIIAYPNPTTAELTIDLQNSDSKITSFEISDVFGKEILSKKSSKPLHTISLENLQPGSYILRLKVGNHIVGVKKFVKI